MLTNHHAGLNISMNTNLPLHYRIHCSREVIVVIFEKLCALIAVQFTISESSILMDTSFVDDLGADSLDVVELTMAIEEEFYIPEVDEDTINRLVTVGDVVRFLSEQCD